jgi:hypothetical protein
MLNIKAITFMNLFFAKVGENREKKNFERRATYLSY